MAIGEDGAAGKVTEIASRLELVLCHGVLLRWQTASDSCFAAGAPRDARLAKLFSDSALPLVSLVISHRFLRQACWSQQWDGSPALIQLFFCFLVNYSDTEMQNQVH